MPVRHKPQHILLCHFIQSCLQHATGMNIDARTPYAGDLVFTAFSGSHQDAISKGMEWRKEGKSGDLWNVPYLPIDPKDVGREYESDIIRINSQSGKGGVAFILKQNFGFNIPDSMKEEVGYLVKNISDKEHKEMTPLQIYDIFEKNYVNKEEIFKVTKYKWTTDKKRVSVTIEQNGKFRKVESDGNGNLNAVSNAIKTYFGISYELSFYDEHAKSKGSSSHAVTYVKVSCWGKEYWGVGVSEDISDSSVLALVSALNKLTKDINRTKGLEEKMMDMLDFIQKNYVDITLEKFSEKYQMSVTDISEYFFKQMGESFQDVVEKAKMKVARKLLKETNLDMEDIAEKVGYDDSNRFFLSLQNLYKQTPSEIRTNR